jgi:alanyl-tRNA synthetase
MKTVNDVRSEFLNFFKDKGHEIVASAPLVPQNDPTLMFTNAGMVPFKNVFTGAETRPYKRATTAQKCVRAGGKHNDLENVGYTARHHTFFEMLGNFSFGDYFKEDAIAFAWELVTKNFALNPERLCVTIYHTDDEAFDIWKKVTGFHDSKIIRIPTSDNFWAMGDTGPCGPCTEIFYDHGDHIPGGPPGSPDEDGDRFIEIWNNVFMQYEQIDADTRIELPNPSIDTGMGLERIAATLMGSHDNYAIDLMRAIIEQTGDITGVNPDGPQSASHRVIADHLRAAAFLIADGVMPSNEGRGYVLRRIMRRGMRNAHLLGANEPLMYQLFPTLRGKMSEAYPELNAASALITETLRGEEERFKRTLDRGLKLLDEETEGLSAGDKFSGTTAFKLYDTFGFPLDLTQDALKAKGISVDMTGFDAAMAEQKAKARAAWSGSGDAATEKLWFEILDEVGPTEFLGYKVEQAEGQVKALVKGDRRVDVLKAGEEGFLITNQTPFYGESGGQVGDHGVLKGDASAMVVTDTKKLLGQIFVHCVKVEEGEIKIGDAVEMIVDHQRRSDIRSNHSATHLLHEALRRVLGEHVSQKGSLQDDMRTRFDISHPKGLSAEEITQVEAIVNAEIRANTPVETRVMPLDEARETGAMALFGEKYDDEVRVVIMGSQAAGENRAFSVELCGGTHVARTGDIGRFKIVSESALSSGVRRVEALTGSRVDAYEAAGAQALQDEHDRLIAINNALREELAAMGGSVDAVEQQKDLAAHNVSLQKDNKKLQKEIDDKRRQHASENAGEADVKDVGGMKFAGRVLAGYPAKDLKPMADDLKAKLGSAVIVLISTDEGKASIVVGVTDDLTDRVSAVDLVRVGSAALGGQGGGGRPDMAQAGGPNADAANDAISAIEKALAS